LIWRGPRLEPIKSHITALRNLFMGPRALIPYKGCSFFVLFLFPLNFFFTTWGHFLPLFPVIIILEGPTLKIRPAPVFLVVRRAEFKLLLWTFFLGQIGPVLHSVLAFFFRCGVVRYFLRFEECGAHTRASYMLNEMLPFWFVKSFACTPFLSVCPCRCLEDIENDCAICPCHNFLLHASVFWLPS